MCLAGVSPCVDRSDGRLHVELLRHLVHGVQRETEQLEGYLQEVTGDWYEAYEELTAAFYELLEENADKATREVRWTAAWLIKAERVEETLAQLVEMTNGITTTREDWHDVPVRVSGAPEWLDEDHADAWHGMAWHGMALPKLTIPSHLPTPVPGRLPTT